MKKKLVLSMLSGSLILATLTPGLSASADVNENLSVDLNESLEQFTVVSDDLIQKADPYIILNENNEFILDKNSLDNAFTVNEINEIEEQLILTNNLIEEEKDGYVAEGNTLTTQPEQTGISTYATSEGINRIDFSWWGAQVWLSKSTVKKILNVGTAGGGAAVGAALGNVPGAVVGAVVGGVLQEFITPSAARAVYIEYKYVVGITYFQIFNK